jgi:hypothetical protein
VVAESLFTFVTLFLSLTRGLQPVELMVTGPVARVELRLDGKLAAEIKGPPWKAPIDFGAAFAPHEIVATVFDAAGHRLGSISQVINLPRPRADLEVLVERNPGGRPSRVRLAWKSAVPFTVRQATLAIDGKPIAVGPDRTADLPSLDLRHPHLLRAEVMFSDGNTARKEIALGGEYMERSQTELTAVPVVLRDHADVPRSADLQDAFRARGTPVAVTAVEETPVTIVIVVGADVRPRWTRLLTRYKEGRLSDTLTRRLFGTDQLVSVEPVPRSAITHAGETVTLFPTYVDAKARRYGFLDSIARYGFGVLPAKDERFAEAVAVAGLNAASGNQRRAVIAVASLYDLASSAPLAAPVRDYLRTLGVPFFVWTSDSELARRYNGPWGGIEDLSLTRSLVEANDVLLRSIERQRIVWVEGRYLPQEIELARSDLGFSLVR